MQSVKTERRRVADLLDVPVSCKGEELCDITRLRGVLGEGPSPKETIRIFLQLVSVGRRQASSPDSHVQATCDGDQGSIQGKYYHT